jgi:hypothetical protein
LNLENNVPYVVADKRIRQRTSANQQLTVKKSVEANQAVRSNGDLKYCRQIIVREPLLFP